MGVGYAVLESLPPYEDGPGNGKWNLGQYRVARGSDLPLQGLEVEVLPPVDADERPKGIAEVVMVPVAAALLNAIFDATGHRFQSLPVTQAMIKGSLN
jgi:CO/xanthine dehydrogenase Mo-binding subunit